MNLYWAIRINSSCDEDKMTPETKALIDTLTFKCSYLESELLKSNKIIESQEKEIEKLKEALQFYADKETYKRWFSKSGEEFKTYPTNARIDIGFKARQALEAK